MGKEKYGGPFTTEQVENVKTFLGIVHVLLIVGPICFADVAFGQNLSGLVHTNEYYYSKYYHDYYNDTVDIPYYAYFYGSGCLTPLLMLVFIPVYLCLLCPLIYDYIPEILKRIGLGMLLCLTSSFCTLVMDVANYKCISGSCILNSYFNISPHFLVTIWLKFNAVSYLLVYVASYEFLCPRALSQ